MKHFLLIFTIATGLAGCTDHSGNKADEGDDSASTAPITDPSYNPKVNADSAAKHMNLDSTVLKDSAGEH
jgi:hypothetical protein